MRVVLDTNVIVSALLSPGRIPSQIMQHWELGYFDLIVSQESLDELARVLRYPKIRKRLASTHDEMTAFVQLFYEHALWVDQRQTINVIVEDPSDNLYLEIALAGQAHYVVSGDQHLLTLKVYQGVPVITPLQFFSDVLPHLSP